VQVVLLVLGLPDKTVTGLLDTVFSGSFFLTGSASLKGIGDCWSRTTKDALHELNQMVKRRHVARDPNPWL